jgi:3-hydroxymyristoyl/3-hydroxydecanoyl-(acyl carrier protein) dehydratase
MWHAIERRFAADHPASAGHFPGNPIIPGALLLDEAVAAIAAALERTGVVLIRAAKFRHPVRPGDTVRMQWRFTDAWLISFECRLVDSDVLAASFTLEVGALPR